MVEGTALRQAAGRCVAGAGTALRQAAGRYAAGAGTGGGKIGLAPTVGDRPSTGRWTLRCGCRN